MESVKRWKEWNPRRIKSPQNGIAFIITLTVMGITIYVAIYTLNNGPKDANGGRDLSLISQTLIPLWSTWIGTVLAYYFGKANFEAGGKSYQDAVRTVLSSDEKIAKVPVKEVMIPLRDIVYLDFNAELNSLLRDILQKKEFAKYNRFAVFDAAKTLKYIIHRSTFYQYIYWQMSEAKPDGNEVDTGSLKLSDLLACTDEKIKNMLERGAGFVPEDASLLDARRVMEAVEECQDVFVTRQGNKTEPVLGLITNNMILQYAKV